MDGARYLLPEDRPDYERVLDEGLRRVRHSADPAAPDITNEQLRRLALDALPLVAPRAADEYDRYLALRTRQRMPEPAPAAEGTGTPSPERSGAGLLAVLSVLVPVLAGIAAVVFLGAGYGLRLATPEPAVAAAMRTTGWAFAVIAVAGLLVAAAELLVGAMRNGSTSVRAMRPGATDLASEVDRARREWLEALLERGVLPFLHETISSGPRAGVGTGGSGHRRLAVEGTQATGVGAASRVGTDTAAEGDAVTETPEDRYHHPDFSRPGFSSRGDDAESDDARSRFLSPKFASPTDRSSEDAGSRSTMPGFSSPRFDTSDAQVDAAGDDRSHGYASPRYNTPDDRVSGGKFGSPAYHTPDQPMSGGKFESPAYHTPDQPVSGGKFGSPAYHTPDQPVSGGKFGSPAYGTSGSSGDSEGSGGSKGKRFATTGYSTPGERADGNRTGSPDRSAEGAADGDEHDGSEKGRPAAND